jgi:hypothetical protein
MGVWEETVMAAAPGAFDRRDGRLYIEDCPLAELAERYGTPLHVISEAALRERAREFQRAFGAAWSHGPVTLLPAVKANYAVTGSSPRRAAAPTSSARGSWRSPCAPASRRR